MTFQALPVFVEVRPNHPRGHYTARIEPGHGSGEFHAGDAHTVPRALILAATHWAIQYEPDLIDPITMIEEITARADAQGSGLVAYPVEDIKALLKLIKGEPAK